MEALTLQTIVDYAGGALRQGDRTRSICGVTTDSRAVGTNALFLALRGERFDGHQFVGTSAQAGAAGAIVERGWSAPALPDDFAVIEVDDTLRAYQRIAKEYRRSLPLKVVAITGSNGKTSTKDLAASTLGLRYRVTKTRGNLNNHIGLPQSLLSASRLDEIAVLEMGMNHPGEIAPLAEIAQPETAIITNIGTAHIEFMCSRQAIALEKGRLAEAVAADGHVILHAEDEFTPFISQRTRATVITVGLQQGDLRAEGIAASASGSSFQIVEGSSRVDVALPVPGAHMVVNALLAAAAGRVYGLSLEECAQGLETVQLTRGRLELKSVAGLQVLDDSYNANPDSMIAALKTLARMPAKGRRIAVLGRMGELGNHSENGHRTVGDAAAREGISYLVTVGSEAGAIAENALAGGLRDVATVSDTVEAAHLLAKIAGTDDLILIKGSRSAAMENILTELAAQLPVTAAPLTS